MTEPNTHKDTSSPHSRVKKGSNYILYLFIFTIFVLVGGFYFYQKNIASLQQSSGSFDSGPSTTQKDSTAAGTGKPLSGNQVSSDSATGKVQNGTINNSATQSEPLFSDDRVTEATLDSTHTATGKTNSTFDEKNIDYTFLISKLNNFYSHLDSQQYMQNFKLSEPSKEHFSHLIQKLLDNPPVVTRETDDLFTLLKNTAHFFRVIGKNNILILKGILDREKDSFETILQSFYYLTNKPEYLKEAYAISLDPPDLYDYAGFFLHTMGGRLYLFRRDSNSRMVVSYYAILLIDRANRAGDSRHGIDIRPAINSLIDEIENGGKHLQLRETYLDTLYDLKERYN